MSVYQLFADNSKAGLTIFIKKKKKKKKRYIKIGQLMMIYASAIAKHHEIHISPVYRASKKLLISNPNSNL